MNPVAQPQWDRAWSIGSRRWPGLSLSQSAFATHVEDVRRLTPAPGEEDIYRHAEDLFLVAACVTGVQRALETFDRAVISRVPAMVAAIDPSYGFGTEVSQALREALFRPPFERLRRYGATGPLTAWVRVVARRIAIDLKRQEGATLRRASDLPSDVISRHPEWELIRRRYRGPLEAALRAAIQDLPARDRAVLRAYLVNGENIDTIGGVHGVHRATVARWLAAAQQAIVNSTVERLERELGLPRAEFEALVADLRSQLEVTLSSLL